MIRSDRQLAQARQKADAARAAAAAARDELDRHIWLDVTKDLDEEISDYVAVRGGARHVFEITSIDDLADALVKARIARGWTQKQLAEELGVTEQMVQRDEAGGYQRASVARLADVADALGFELHGRLQPAALEEEDAPVERVRLWSDNAAWSTEIEVLRPAYAVIFVTAGQSVTTALAQQPSFSTPPALVSR